MTHSSNMHARDLLKKTTNKFRAAGIDSPALDAELLLMHVLHIDRISLITHKEKIVRASTARRFRTLVARRLKREPIAYILGTRWFYETEFKVNRHTLIPRPETETLIECVIEKMKTSSAAPIIFDIGTGSGAIAITLAKLFPRITIIATDSSTKALRLAKMNAQKNKTRVKFLKGDLLKPAQQEMERTKKPLFIAANLPYVPSAQWRTLQPEIKKYEPRSAVDGGVDGLKYYRELLKQLKAFPLKQNISLFFEYDPTQTSAFKKLILTSFPSACVTVVKDLAKKDRVLIIET